MKPTWKNVLLELQAKYPQDYDLWFIQLQFISYNKKDSILTLSLPNQTTLNIIKERFDTLFKDALIKEGFLNIQIEYIVDTNSLELFQKQEKPVKSKAKKQESTFNNPSEYLPDLNPKFTFDRFVSGSNTDIIFKAAQLIAQQKDPNFERFNPFFIYGRVGLGKTHLMQAIGNYMVEHSPHLRVVYTTAEKYMNDWIEATIERRFKAFREFYREANVLLIDDVQFLENKEKIQDEIFNNFNKLYQHNQQIILTCDKHPKELKNVQERLINRFSWGLTVDIKAPDFQTRKMIIEKKLIETGLLDKVSPEIIDFLAENITQNIRDIESAITKIDSILLLTDQKITIDLIKETLSQILTPIKVLNMGLSVLSIQKVVADYYHISVSDIKSKNRSKHITFPRHMAIYISKQVLPLSLSKIGEEFGQRDHSTMLSSIKKIEQEMKNIQSIRHDYEEILKILT